jgi:uncharacterized protein (TIGR02757 family)
VAQRGSSKRATSRPRPARRCSQDDLRERLEGLYASYNLPDAAIDPVNVVRRYRALDDVEIAGFLAAALAFGRVASVIASIETLLVAMGPSPAAFVRGFDPAEGRRRFATFVHRWTRGADIVALLWILRQIVEHAGSLEAYFLEGDEPGAADVGPALDAFSRRALAIDTSPAYGRHERPRPGVAYFFPCPSSGSGCKRLNLFLRWMVRRDGVDFGTWRRVSPARLVVPLDTHVIRLGRCLGLTRYRSPGWTMAEEITAALRALDATDPVRYDFSLCHVGMMGACGFGTAKGDAHCPLRGCCRPSRRLRAIER